MNADRSERERRLMASILEREELITRASVVRENARRRNLARHARNRARAAGARQRDMSGWGRDRIA